MKVDPTTGLMPYKNIGDCFVKVSSNYIFRLFEGEEYLDYG